MLCLVITLFFFFKQKTAYEMRISDWSSDVCSSDLIDRAAAARCGLNIADVQEIIAGAIGGETIGQTVEGLARYPINVRYPRELRDSQIGRASCRERVCQYV